MKRVLLATALCAAAALAQGPGGANAPARTPSFDSLKTYLALTDAQVTSLTQLRTQQRTELETLRPSIREKQQAVQTELEKTAPSAATLGQLMIDVKNARAQTTTIAARYRTQAQAVLTDAQRTKLASLDQVAQLRDEVREAMAAGLLAPPTNAAGVGAVRGRGFGGRGGFSRGPRMSNPL